MTFTEEDAKDNGKIKAEASTSMKQVAARENSELYDYYQQVCGNMGIDPGTDLADLAVRALEDEAFADRILNTQVDLRKIKANEIRTQDMKQVKELYEEFKNDDGPGFDIEKIIEERLQQKASGPLSGPRGSPLSGGSDTGGGSNAEVEQLRKEVRRLQSELEDERRSEANQGRSNQPVMENTEDENNAQDTGNMGVSATDEEDVDELFADESVEEDNVTVTEVQIDAESTDEGGMGDSVDSSGDVSTPESDTGTIEDTGNEEAEVDDTSESGSGGEDSVTVEGDIEDEFDPEGDDDE